MDSGKNKKPKQKPRKNVRDYQAKPHSRKNQKPPSMADALNAAINAFLNSLGIQSPQGNLYLCLSCKTKFTCSVLPQYCPNCRRAFFGTTETGTAGTGQFPPKPKIPKMSRKQAARVLLKESDYGGPWQALSMDPGIRHNCYRRAAKRLHPDNRETGNEESFKKLQDAMEVLETP